MSEEINEIIKFIADTGYFAYVVAGFFLLFGIILVRRKIISASGRSVAFEGENSGAIITGDINKTPNGFLAVLSTIAAIIGVLLMGVSLLIAYLAWQYPVSG